MPTVSIIIPTYNREHLLGRAIQSILNQTYQDFELIIVDDGSTDNTEKLVRKFNSERIKYIRHGENKGPSTARNTGIKSAKGDYIAFQDSDDEWMPEKLEKQIGAFEVAPPEVGIVYTGWYAVINNKKRYLPPAGVNPKDGDLFSTLLRRSLLGTPAALIKRECFERAGMFDERFPPAEDWELFLRMSKFYQFKYINEPLVMYYRQLDSISIDQTALIRASKLLLETYFEDIKRDKRVLANYYFILGHLLCSYGELTQGRSYCIRSIKACPVNIKVFGVFVVSLLGKNMYNMVAEIYQRTRWIALKR